MIRDLPNESIWSIGGVGDTQLPMNALAVAAGGGVRVGLEDNLWFDRGRTRLATNADLLRRVHDIIVANDRELMPASELRQVLHLEPGHGRYGRHIRAGLPAESSRTGAVAGHTPAPA